MIGYEIELHGLEEQLAKLAQFDRIADKRLVTAMHQATITVESAVRPLAPVGVSGRLRNSIASQVTHEGPLSVVGKVGSTLKDEVYPAVMEFGRKPGKMPPYSEGTPLARWVHLVLGDAIGAFVVARGIGRRGIKGKFFMKRGWEQSKGRVQGFFETALQLIAKDLENGRR